MGCKLGRGGLSEAPCGAMTKLGACWPGLPKGGAVVWPLCLPNPSSQDQAGTISTVIQPWQ